jgi:hypothetical protein
MRYMQEHGAQFLQSIADYQGWIDGVGDLDNSRTSLPSGSNTSASGPRRTEDQPGDMMADIRAMQRKDGWH